MKEGQSFIPRANKTNAVLVMENTIGNTLRAACVLKVKAPQQQLIHKSSRQITESAGTCQREEDAQSP